MSNINKFFLPLFSILLLSLIVGCSQKLIPISKTDKIVSFGDSLTYGYGSTEGNSYPEILSKITGYTIVKNPSLKEWASNVFLYKTI